MTPEYQIYLVNEGVRTQTFSCFLEPPMELLNEARIFANSGVSLAVPPHSPAINAFTLFDQYLVGAGAGPSAIEARSIVRPTIELPADLRNRFLASFANVPPPQNPLLDLLGNGAGRERIRVLTNSFDQQNNQAHGWFGHLFFGISTRQGSSGITWAPTPKMRWTFTPSPVIHVAAGDFRPNQLIPWNEIAQSSGVASIPESFSQRKATVTYTSRGLWEVSPGPPRQRRSVHP